MERSNKYSNTSSVLEAFSEAADGFLTPNLCLRAQRNGPQGEGRKAFDAHPKRAYNPARCLSFRCYSLFA
jgi:hypothetical protein